MKKVLVIACVAALLLTIASVAMAGTETDWRLALKSSTLTGTNAVNELWAGTRTGSLDGQDTGIGKDTTYVAPADNQTAIVSYRTEGWTSPYWRTDLMAPIVAPEAKIWDLVLWTGTNWSEGAAVKLSVWSTSTYSPVGTIGGVPYEYTIKVISDPTGTYDAGSIWAFTPGAAGTSAEPVFSMVFNNGELMASGNPDAYLNGVQLQLTAAPIPEPGSMLALASGLVGMAGFAIRRRRA